MRLLVASHDASRTGAPLLLLTFLRWLRRETDAEVQLVLWRGGPLAPAFGEVAEVVVLHPEPGRRSLGETVELGLTELGMSSLGQAVTRVRVRARLRVKPHDVLFLNGAGSALVAPHLHSTAPTLAHVHELDRGLTFALRGRGRRAVLAADRIIAVSQAVADCLVDRWVVDPKRVSVVHGCVPDRAPGVGHPQPAPPRGQPLVGSVGSGSWRKGVDLFLQVAAGVHRAGPGDVQFAWVGPLDDEAAVRSDARALGIEAVLHLPGEVIDPTPWMEAMSVFCSTAREDPFPLVALEAGAAGVPIIAFDSGGIAELLADGRGTIIPTLDVPAMIEGLIAALADPESLPDAGARLARHVRSHHTVDQLGPALWNHVSALVEADPRRAARPGP